MSFVKKVLTFVAIAAVIYFAPYLAPEVAAFIGTSSGFVTALIGSAIVAAGLTIVSAVMGGSKSGADMDAGKVNVRIAEPKRWLCAGRARQGGGALFGEFDSSGNFWYIVVHSDSTLESAPQYILDDLPVTLDGSGYVFQKEFRLQTNENKDPAEFNGQGKGYVRIWTTTYTEGNPTPPAIAALNSALPSLWTSNHKLVGTTFSVVKMDAIEIEHRSKIYTWRGPFGMGEPAVSVVGDWSKMYDPRDPTQILGNRSTYKTSRNPSLIWAWWRTHPYGRNKPESSINWDKVAEQADICDQIVVGVYGNQKRYECGVSFIDDKKRADAETEILLTMDGQLVFDQDGKTWVRAGHWYAPTLALSRNRDIMAMSSQEAQDGESETHGVIVRYLDPDARYTAQPSAAWINPIYYDPTTTPKFMIVDVLGCQNHNQAMRLAKGIGMRSQPRHKISPIIGLRGLRAREERIISLNYDNTFAGDYEIATPLELDGAGVFTTAGMVPIDENRWTLLPGEEAAKPVVDSTIQAEIFPPIIGETIAIVDGAILLTLPAQPRADATYAAEYILSSEITGSINDPWIPLSVNINTAISPRVIEGVSYTVRYRYTVGSGRGPAWEYQVVSASLTVMPVTNLTVVAGVGEAEITWRNPNDMNFEYAAGFRNTTTDFGSATKIFDNYAGGLGQIQTVTDSVAAGTYYWWVVAYTATGNPSSPTGPATGVVT